MCLIPTQGTGNTADFYLILISCDHWEQILNVQWKAHTQTCRKQILIAFPLDIWEP